MNNFAIMHDIKRLKTELIPQDRLVLFGSRARGDARKDSDWDMLMVLHKDRITSQDFDDYAYPFVELGWSKGEYFSMKLYTDKEWAKREGTPFYINVESEGIDL